MHCSSKARLLNQCASFCLNIISCLALYALQCSFSRRTGKINLGFAATRFCQTCLLVSVNWQLGKRLRIFEMSKQSDQLRIETRDGQADKQPAGSNISALELLAQAGSLPGAARGQRGADTHVKSLEITSPYGDKVAAASTEKDAPVDPKDKFSLGVNAMSRAEIMQKNPALLGTINDVIEDANEPEKVQYKGMKEPMSSEVYKADAIGQMATKYGLSRVEDMFKALGQASGGGKAESYRFELMTNGRPEKLTANLRNMAELCAPGGVERLRELTGKLREEGSQNPCR